MGSAFYAITDDLLKMIGYPEDARVQLSGAEVIPPVLMTARFFGGKR